MNLNNLTKNLKMREGGEASEGEGHSVPRNPPAQPKKKYWVNSLEEVDAMTDSELTAVAMGGGSRKRQKMLMSEEGIDYLEAKRRILKENFCLSQNKATESRPLKRPRSMGGTPEDKEKRAKLEGTFKEALNSKKIAVVDVNYPKEHLASERLIAIQKAIVSAIDKIPLEGPQVRLAKSTHRPGFLVITCGDGESADWLKGVVPSLDPWEGATLRALEEADIPKPHVCTVFIPDEEAGQRLTREQILTRLRVCNRSLRTDLWSVWGSTPLEKGQIWTFSIDEGSEEEIRNQNMTPYFGIGRIRFKMKDPLPLEKVTTKKAREGQVVITKKTLEKDIKKTGKKLEGMKISSQPNKGSKTGTTGKAIKPKGKPLSAKSSGCQKGEKEVLKCTPGSVRLPLPAGPSERSQDPVTVSGAAAGGGSREAKDAPPQLPPEANQREHAGT